jgi:hypothetical protein
VHACLVAQCSKLLQRTLPGRCAPTNSTPLDQVPLYELPHHRRDETVAVFANAAGAGLSDSFLLGPAVGSTAAAAAAAGAGGQGACRALAFRTGPGVPLMAAAGGAGEPHMVGVLCALVQCCVMAQNHLGMPSVPLPDLLPESTWHASGICAVCKASKALSSPVIIWCGSCTHAGVITVWDLEQRRLHTVIKDAHDAPVVSLHFFAGEPLLMSAGGCGCLWRRRGG